MSCINVPLVSTALVQPDTERPFLEFNIWQTAKETENESNKMTWHSWQNHLCWSPLSASPPPPPPHHHHHHTAVSVTSMETVLLFYPSVHRDMKASWFGFLTLSPNDATVTSHGWSSQWRLFKLSPENRITLRSVIPYPTTVCRTQTYFYPSNSIRWKATVGST
jgi:hypothetical protein